MTACTSYSYYREYKFLKISKYSICYLFSLYLRQHTLSLVESVPSIKFILIHQPQDSLNLCSQGAYSIIREVKHIPAKTQITIQSLSRDLGQKLAIRLNGLNNNSYRGLRRRRNCITENFVRVMILPRSLARFVWIENKVESLLGGKIE